ncbi:MAG: hypothetical protein A3H51_01170 [Candidatus Spechtbacteria bacterium RIFCSPLOWO2_02_FULL_38_8]|uniref:Signal peptidase n=1 Tax=Candidatus Spechtbacteria bacterium RIFCSPLOWO2_02_FULL_38_8 TaxID=1802164 RepID=A0A1G2HI20_9BACT|nr:MAG: hypothetical protein A3H51_01170 [Candidatus Spechtbacteria bacterium RIFCSPLOWO2_02_FULL_38_8]
MKKVNKKLLQVAAGAVMVAGVSTVSTQSLAAPKCAVEKCYGIVNKAKNECGSPKHACAGQAKTSGNGQEWMLVMKGSCNSIQGGSTKPFDGNNKVTKTN